MDFMIVCDTPLRLAVLDVDGTLADPENRIRPDVARAVNALLQRDVLVMLATGRTISELQPVFGPCPGLTHLAYSNGACLRGFGPALDSYARTIPLEAAQAVYDRAMAADIMPEVYSRGQVYVAKSRWADRDHYNAAYLSQTLPGSRTVIQDLQLLWENPETMVEKLNLFFHDPRQRAAFEASLQGLGLGVSYTIQGGLEYNNPQATKVGAVSHLCRVLHIPAGQVAALGDSQTDIDLLRWAGVSVAMANGAPEVQQAARFIAPPNSQSGAAWAIENLLLPRCAAAK